MDFMKYALIEAEKAMEAEEIPVGAIVVKDEEEVIIKKKKRIILLNMLRL